MLLQFGSIFSENCQESIKSHAYKRIVDAIMTSAQSLLPSVSRLMQLPRAGPEFIF